ncbi:hypothetical protein [Anaerotignum sp.]|nr:hypothetical protein [Anaerotignum sp.]MBQ7758340.1 hypothetical protein [Anaerotignum sp.]
MHQKRRHYRVALREIKESPAEGIYVTNEELRKYGIFAGIVLFLLTVVAVFDRKH